MLAQKRWWGCDLSRREAVADSRANHLDLANGWMSDCHHLVRVNYLGILKNLVHSIDWCSCYVCCRQTLLPFCYCPGQDDFRDQRDHQFAILDTVSVGTKTRIGDPFRVT